MNEPSPNEPEIQPKANGDRAGDYRSDRAKTGKRRRWACCLIVFILLCLLATVGNWLAQQARRQGLPVPDISPRSLPWPMESKPEPMPTPHVLPKTFEGVIKILKPVVEERFRPKAEQMGIAWPPPRTRLIGLKLERSLEVWIANSKGPFKLLKTYPVLAASGDIGPKRKEGDKQVPEGHYRLVYLNPDSDYHLSLLLDYPNAADIAREKEALSEGVNLGGSICVHGSNMSIGCLAIGDSAIEEVFTLVALAKPSHRDIIILPADFRKRPDLISLAGDDAEVLDLYTDLIKLMDTVQ